MLLERHLQIILSDDPVIDLGSLVRVLLLTQVDTEFGLLLGLPFVLVLGRYTFHPEDLDVVSIPSRQSVLQPVSRLLSVLGTRSCNERRNLLVGLRLVYLLTMYHQTSGGVQLSGTMTTFEVLRLLMLQEDYRKPSVSLARSIL